MAPRSPPVAGPPCHDLHAPVKEKTVHATHWYRARTTARLGAGSSKTIGTIIGILIEEYFGIWARANAQRVVIHWSWRRHGFFGDGDTHIALWRSKDGANIIRNAAKMNPK